MIWSSAKLAWREILNNPLRSGLTVIGIVIGVAAVIALVTLGNGATARVTSDISGLGRNLLVVVPSTDDRPGPPQINAKPFKIADVEAIRRDVTSISAAAAAVSRPVQVVYGNENRRTTLNGGDNSYFGVRDWAVVEGRIFTEAELKSGRAVCLLGATVRRELFGSQSPIGLTFRVGPVPCKVIGVMEEKGQSTLGSDQDDFVLAPLVMVQRRIAGNENVDLIFVSAVTSDATGKAQEDIRKLMRERRGIRPGESDNFLVRDMKEVTEIIGSVTGVLTAFLGAIAAISLLVGGIGIMNIMLVSVTERTREIGIRLAIGARESEVLMQFLIEAVLLSSLGGVVGILLGLGLTLALSQFLDLPIVFDATIVAIAFVFSAAVGVVFGFFPARRAARLDPIDALRYE